MFIRGWRWPCCIAVSKVTSIRNAQELVPFVPSIVITSGWGRLRLRSAAVSRQAALTIDATAVSTAVRPTHYEVVRVLAVGADSLHDLQDWCRLLRGVRSYRW